MPDYSDQTEDELLIALATVLFGDKIKSFGPSELRRAVEDARRWANNWISKNRAALCRGLDGLGLRSQETRDAIVDGAAVVDLVAGLGLGHASATVLAALIIKWGVPVICG